jgi:phosphoribosylaminoimidazolecarboxamide formyltransferase/IMP cyclohydrolase
MRAGGHKIELGYSMKRALISVSDKTGIIEFASKLIKMGYEIVSTGGTLKTLSAAGLVATAVSDVTGFPEILDGRVKTLNPMIHGGILCMRDEQKHRDEIATHDIVPIDMLVINLYPFEKTINNPNSRWSDIVENIDIGGPAMLRAGAKNYKYVDVLIDPHDYDVVLEEISRDAGTRETTRLRLAQKVFGHISAYDSLISKVMADEYLALSYQQSDENSRQLDEIAAPIALRYGENPHQSAIYYSSHRGIIEQLYGKELSYNNYLDIDAAIKTIYRFDHPTVAILKHTNPCGIASHENISRAYELAFATDTISPFGGIVVTNSVVDVDFVETINRVFTELVIAPSFTDNAMTLLKKKKDRRVIAYSPELVKTLSEQQQIVSCLDGYLLQDVDLELDDETNWTIPTVAQPTDQELDECRFAWQVVKMLKSNAICFTKDKQTIGMGIGQTSRIDSMSIAINRAKNMELNIEGSVCASDGFFPFRDSIDLLVQVGVKCFIQPGGSKADPEIIAACDEHGIVMVLTGRRHFRH